MLAGETIEKWQAKSLFVKEQANYSFQDVRLFINDSLSI